jgi:hypothetical protein
MKLPGHESPKMTMRYVEVSLLDVGHEFRLATVQPRHLVPTPKVALASSVTPDMTGFPGSLNTSAVICRMVRPAVASTGSPIASPKLPRKRENSIRSKHGISGSDWPVNYPF